MRETTRVRRMKKREQEDRMKNILRKHASVAHPPPFLASDRPVSVSSSASTESIESAASRKSQLLTMIQKPSFRHLRVFVTFEFGLLTTKADAPPQGPYESLRSSISEEEEGDDGLALKKKSEILFKIINRAGVISTGALEERSGNVLMFLSPERSPFITFVKRDCKLFGVSLTFHVHVISLSCYVIFFIVFFCTRLTQMRKTIPFGLLCADNYQSPKDRPGLVRCVISAVIPISVASGDGSFTETSKIMARVIVRKALIEGVQKQQLFT